MGRKKRRKGSPNHPLPSRHDNPAPISPENPTSGISAQRLTRVQAQVSAFRGPLPPPEILREYDQILPGLAERVVTMAENQSRHRQDVEKSVISTRNRNETLGQIFGFILALVIAGGSIWLIFMGKKIEGLATIIAEIASLAGIFIYARRKQQKELSQKKQAIEESG